MFDVCEQYQLYPADDMLWVGALKYRIDLFCPYFFAIRSLRMAAEKEELSLLGFSHSRQMSIISQPPC